MLLLHGLGATGGVWQGVEAITPAVAPDLPGHGAAAWHETYTFTSHAEAVLPLLEVFDRPVPVVGHSMGGVVALELAALAPDRVSRAVERYLRVSGLAGLVRSDDPMVERAVVDREAAGEGSGWRLAQDPRTFGVGVPDMARLLATARCPVVLARGEHDPMVAHEQLADLAAEAVTLLGLGHNAHVEDPAAVLALLT
jgi:pimeloyl-ACP methyl ester carboxylesterase